MKLRAAHGLREGGSKVIDPENRDSVFRRILMIAN